MKLGFIGTGSMGSILIEALIQSGAVTPAQITASNRTRRKAEALAWKYPGLTAARSNVEAVTGQDIVFICVKPAEYKRVLTELKPLVQEHQIVVSITSPVLIRHLENLLPCKIAKVIPSITNYERSGATLCMYGSRMEPDDCAKLEQLLAHISTPMRIDETFTRVSSDLSSCGPAFLAFVVQQLIDAAVQETGMDPDEATRLACEMVLGTGKLLTSGGFAPDELIRRVAVPGGITAAGLKLLSEEMSGVFRQLIRITHAKYEEDLEKTEAAFYGINVE